jgi:hypothetical protein
MHGNMNDKRLQYYGKKVYIFVPGNMMDFNRLRNARGKSVSGQL